MPDLAVNPAYLETLATRQTAATPYAEAASGATNELGHNCWITHGAISGCSNDPFGSVAALRKAAGETIKGGSALLAAKLRAAKQAYEGVDGELADNLNKQMVDK